MVIGSLALGPRPLSNQLIFPLFPYLFPYALKAPCPFFPLVKVWTTRDDILSGRNQLHLEKPSVDGMLFKFREKKLRMKRHSLKLLQD